VALERDRSESRLHIGVGANNEKLLLFLGQVLVPRLVRVPGQIEGIHELEGSFGILWQS
jgi:hypothetical protein